MYCLIIPLQSIAQDGSKQHSHIVEQIEGCWQNIKEPALQVCFQPGNRLLFKNSEAGKTIRRKWKLLPSGLIRIKFIFLFRPKYRIANLTEQYLKLVPVNRGVVIELKR